MAVLGQFDGAAQRADQVEDIVAGTQLADSLGGRADRLDDQRQRAGLAVEIGDIFQRFDQPQFLFYAVRKQGEKDSYPPTIQSHYVDY